MLENSPFDAAVTGPCDPASSRAPAGVMILPIRDDAHDGVTTQTCFFDRACTSRRRGCISRARACRSGRTHVCVIAPMDPRSRATRTCDLGITRAADDPRTDPRDDASAFRGRRRSATAGENSLPEQDSNLRPRDSQWRERYFAGGRAYAARSSAILRAPAGEKWPSRGSQSEASAIVNDAVSTKGRP